MPLVEMGFVKGTLTADEKADLARKVTELVAQASKTPKEHIWVVIHEEPHENLMFGGRTIQQMK